MKALVSSPGVDGNIAFEDVDEPVPAPGEAVVEMKSSSLNRGEVRALQSAGAWRPGWDVAGVVAVAAEDGTGPGPGARVVGLAPSGAWAERVAVATGQMATLPDEVTFEEAATLPVAGLTARRATEMCVIEGRRVAVTGAAGGVGHFAVQLAAQSAAIVTAVVGTPERGAGLEQLGAAEIVVGALPPEGEPLTLVLESVGGDSLAAALSRVAPDGVVVSFGNSSGAPTTFDVNTFYGKSGARLYAFVLSPELQRTKSATTDLRYLANQLAAGHLDVGIDRVVDWSDLGAVRAAIADLLARKVESKVVLRIGA
jgi:NADPH:quinone reductase-like Zn-dependent oxidoreductase